MSGMTAGNLSAAFTENNREDAEAKALAWIAAEPFIETWKFLGLWQPRADRPFFFRAEFDVTYKPRKALELGL